MTSWQTLRRIILEAVDPDNWPLLKETLARWKKRKILPADVFEALEDELKGTAGRLAKVYQTLFVQEIYESLERAIKEGKTVREWTQEAQQILDKYGASEGLKIFTGERWKPGYADMVFRTNVQQAYAAGRYADAFSGENLDFEPYWQYHAVHDDRTRPTHMALDGKVFRKDDEAARHWLPPWDFNCRCATSFLTEGEFERGKHKLTAGREIPGLPQLDENGKPILDKDGNTIPTGRPPKGWDADRVEALVPGTIKPEIPAEKPQPAVETPAPAPSPAVESPAPVAEKPRPPAPITADEAAPVVRPPATVPAVDPVARPVIPPVETPRPVAVPVPGPVPVPTPAPVVVPEPVTPATPPPVIPTAPAPTPIPAPISLPPHIEIPAPKPAVPDVPVATPPDRHAPWTEIDGRLYVGGGTLLLTLEMARLLRKAVPGQVEVTPGVWATPKARIVSLYEQELFPFVEIDPNGTARISVTDETLAYYGKDRARLQSWVDKYNRGQRWIRAA